MVFKLKFRDFMVKLYSQGLLTMKMCEPGMLPKPRLFYFWKTQSAYLLVVMKWSWLLLQPE
ncbi:MAG: hypothetical protein C0605_07345 [Hyphomicrobiales bacterium]|nr:MAG: hypothetical protein C0605_07345 [Hyphomicrobiales bacterium]